MLEDNTIDKINTLYIEWHERWLPNEDENSKAKLMKELKNRNVKIIDWH